MSEETFTFFYTGPFSQWKVCKFSTDEGVIFTSAEQYMMYKKAKLFNDTKTAKMIMEATKPKDQKALGRLVKNFDKQKWDAVARDIVYNGNYHKFKQNPDLWRSLELTKGTTLVEASPTDRIWGIGLDAKDKRCLSRDTWLGTNWLGEVLVKVRDDLEARIYRTSDFNWSKKGH